MISICLKVDELTERKMMEDYLYRQNQSARSPLFEYKFCSSQNLMREVMQDGAELVCVQLHDMEDLSMLREIRRRNSQVELMILCCNLTLACACMDPFIRPLCFLKEPLEKTLLHREFGKVYRYLLERNHLDSKKDVFRFSIRRLERRMPYSQIRYLETRNKKLILHSLYGEYEFYDSFCRIEELLPDYFVRCHRSYIVNLAYITGVDLTGMYMILEGQEEIPISRKYRRQLEGI